MKKKMTALFLALSMGLSLFPTALAEEDAAGLSTADNALPVSEETEREEFNIFGEELLLGYTGPGGDVVIPDGIVSIDSRVFAGRDDITSITIPDSVTRIGQQAFAGTGLTSITIPDSVTEFSDSVFKGCTELTYVALGSGVRSISEFLFCDCTGLEQFTVPDGCISIEEWAFHGCDNLTVLTIPASVTSIGNYIGAGNLSAIVGQAGSYAETYAGKKGYNFYEGSVPQEELDHIAAGLVIRQGVLTQYTGPGGQVRIPEGVTAIREGVFDHCDTLTGVVLPESLTSIGNWAFRECTGLTSLTIPDSVTSMGNYAFQGCAGLRELTVGAGLAKIDSSWFGGCSQLTSVTLSPGLKSIEGRAFSDCSNLTGIVIPDTVTSIGGSAFRNCSALRQIDIPSSVTSIGREAFAGCTGLTQVSVGNIACDIASNAFPEGVTLTDPNGSNAFEDFAIRNGVVTKYTGIGGNVVIPAGVTAIGHQAFAGLNKVYSVTIPEGVTQIDTYAFSDCTGLERVVIPDSVTEIRTQAFDGCSKLSSVTLGNGVEIIGYAAFRGCESLKSIALPGTLRTLEGEAFRRCSAMETVTIAPGVTTIGKDAFWNCSSLTGIELPDSVTSLGANAFLNCSKLARVTLGAGIRNIENKTFYSCDALSDVTFGKNLYTIGDEAFSGCAGLTGLTVPDGVASIGVKAFANCSGLKSVFLPDSVKILGEDAFSGCSSLTDVTAPDRLGAIVTDFLEHRDFTIRDGKLTKYTGVGGNVVLPGDVTSIGSRAFADCKTLTGVTIPGGVTSIDSRAFANCTALSRVSGGKGLTSCAQDAFSGCSKLTVLDLPDRFLNGAEAFTIENGTLKKYTGLALKVEVPDGVTAIASGAFGGISAQRVTFPSTLTTISDGALVNMSGLTDVVIPASVTQIGDIAFSYYGGDNGTLYKTSDLTVHGAAGSYAETWAKRVGYQFVADQAWNVSDLAKEHKFTIENGVLKGYTGPGGDVVVPDGVTEIYYGVLDSIGMLDSLTLPAGIKRVSINNPTVKRIVMGSGAVNVNLKCDQLESVSLPDSVETLNITSKALRELAIPAGVTMWPSLSCPRLNKLTFPSGNWVFKGISRADFMERIRSYPALNQVVNCPNEFVDDLIAANKALMDNWTDPQSTITSQSDRITRLSNEITAGLTADYDKARAISQWVVDHIKYDDDYYYEGLKDYSDVPFHPEDILDKGQAVCAGISRLTQALMVAQKIPCLYVLGSAGGSHAWNLALIDGEYLWIDNTWGMNYFGIGVYAISRDHTATGAASFNNVKGPGTLVSGSAGAEEATETAEEILVREKIEALREQYPEGKRWTNSDSYYSAALHSTGSGCAGFAYLCSDTAFGDAPVVETHSDFTRIRVGDILRINHDTHSVIVLKKLSDSVIVAEGNYNSSIHWGREISRSELEKGEMKVTTRWGGRAQDQQAQTWLTASSWAQAEVEAAITASLVPEALQSNYTDLITRREFCTLMVTLVEQKSGQDIGAYLNSKGLSVANPFTDTTDSNVLAAYALGIVKGTSATTFNPNGSITRQEAAAMLQRTGKLLGIRAGEGQDFADKAQFGSWAAEGIGYVSGLVDADSGKRVMEGTGGGNFSPLDTYSREQAILTALRLSRCA